MTDAILPLAHALSDPTRLAILLRLQQGEQCVCTLTDLLEAGQSRLSFHLKVLKDAGLVSGRREGRWSYYRLRPEALFDAAARIAALATTSERGDLVPSAVRPRAVPVRATDSACCA